MIRVNRIIILLCLLLYSGCQLGSEKNNYGQFNKYVKEYMEYSKKYKVNNYAALGKLSSIEVGKGSLISLNPNTLAYCRKYGFNIGFLEIITSTQIVVSPDFMKYSDEQEIRFVIIHELAHCLHNVDHTSAKKDLMYKYVPNYIDKEVTDKAIEKYFQRLAKKYKTKS